MVYALESAFRAADTLIRAPRDLRGLALYGETIRDKLATHLTRRKHTYAEASHRFTTPFWSFQTT